jgi:hypothetical protein
VDGVDRKPACLTDLNLLTCDGGTATVSQPVAFGGQNEFFFHGQLDEVRIYRRALSPSEVTALYSGTVCP